MELEALLTPRRCSIAIVVLAFAAFFPALLGDINSLDDERFIVENEEVHTLSLAQAARFFSDPTTVDPRMWEGIYRPLRTLDFAIDWAIAGERAWFYHLRSLVYHVLASLLAYALFRRLARSGVAAFCGALLFSLHPVQTECVAWITSRGDLIFLCLFLLALNLHLKRRYPFAALALAAALFAKEVSVVFPAAVLLTDLLAGQSRLGGLLARWLSSVFSPKARRAATGPLKEEWRRLHLPVLWYAVYAVLVGAFYLYWRSLMPEAGHMAPWWGGSYLANLQTMVRGLLHYAYTLVMPARLVYDYHVPAVTTIDAGTVLALLLLVGLVTAALRGGGLARFSLLWFAVTILPTSNLLFTVGIPTAERFLYLPTVGLALGAGHLVARLRARPLHLVGLGGLLVLCLGALTFDRCRDWKSHETLFAATERAAETPRLFVFRATMAMEDLQDAFEKLRNGSTDPSLKERMNRDAEVIFLATDDFFRFYRVTLRTDPPGQAGLLLSKKANALAALYRDEEARTVAQAAAHVWGGGAYAHFNAGLAAQNLAGRLVGGAPAATGGRRVVECALLTLVPGPFPGVGSLLRIARPAIRSQKRRNLLKAAEYFEESADELDAAVAAGYRDADLRNAIAYNLQSAADLRIELVETQETEEQKGEMRLSAAKSFEGAANLRFSLRDRAGAESVAAALQNFTNAGMNYQLAAVALTPYRTSGAIVGIHRRAGEALLRAGDLHQGMGRPAAALDLYQRAAFNLEEALKRAILSRGPDAGTELRRLASTALVRAAGILELGGELGGARELYQRSMQLFPNTAAREALRRLLR